MMKQIISKISLNILLGAVLIFVWSRLINLNDVYQKLLSVSPEVIFPFVFFFIISASLRSLRLQKILKIPGLVFKDLLFLNFLSQFLSLMIPLRAGEISKSVYLSNQFDIPFSKLITWIFIDRFMDFMAFIMVVVLLINFVPVNLPLHFLNILILILVILVILFFIAVKKAHHLKSLVEYLSRLVFFPGLKKKFLNFSLTIIEGFSILDRQPRELILIFLLSFLAAISDGFIMLVVFRQFTVNFSLVQGTLGNALNAFTYLIPAAPGFVGSAEAAGLAVFGGILGVNADIASAAIVLSHILTIMVLAVLSLAALYFLKFDLNQVWKKLRNN